MSNLFEAHKQWRDRPADERYNTLAELHAATQARRAASVRSDVRLNELRWEPLGNEVVLAGKKNKVMPTHWAFHQLAQLTDLPAQLLRRQPAELACRNLNWGMENAPREQMQMLWANGSQPGVVRSFTSLTYGRLWDEELVGWLRAMTDDENNGWRRPRAKDEAERGPAGIYGGDRNIFVFLVNDKVRLEDGSPEGLGRGFFCWNSEVRQMSFGFRAFLYRYVCGNHIVWGAKELFSLRLFHVGERMGERALRELRKVMDGYLGQSAERDQVVINAARQKSLGSPEATLDLLTGRKMGFSRADATEMMTAAVAAGDDPTNLWALVNAGTSLSHSRPNADERNKADQAASKLLEMVF